MVGNFPHQGADMPNNDWRKSSQCDSGSCVEVRMANELIEVRDSKAGDNGPTLAFAPDGWSAFLADVEDGWFSSIK
jgi:uncharacterized protein DUF397